MKNNDLTNGGYGLKDLAAPFIQFKGSLGDCYREARGLGMCGIYRREDCGWVTVAIRYFNKFTLAKNIVCVKGGAL